MDQPRTKSELRATKPSRQEIRTIDRFPVSLVLDSLKAAHNIGTILRLADALLVEQVFICGNTIVPPNSKIKIGSRGAERWVPWTYAASATDAVCRLKGDGYLVVAAEASEKSIKYDKLNVPRWPVALGRVVS